MRKYKVIKEMSNQYFSSDFDIAGIKSSKGEIIEVKEEEIGISTPWLDYKGASCYPEISFREVMDLIF